MEAKEWNREYEMERRREGRGGKNGARAKEERRDYVSRKREGRSPGEYS